MKRATTLTTTAVFAAALALPGAALAAGGDRDHDGLPDRWEQRYHVTSAASDTDHDGLSNLTEYQSGTNPRTADSDHDGILDDDEDRDNDHVDNGNEQLEGTDPARADSDGDGRRDGREDADHDGLDNAAEDAAGTDPTDADSDNDGVRDGAEITGVIVSFTDGRLVLRRAGGGEIAGAVTADTEITCDTEDAYEDDGVPPAPAVAAARHQDESDGPNHDDGVAQQDEGSLSAPHADTASGPALNGADGAPDAAGPDDGTDETAGACSADDLVPGTVVHQAESTTTPDGLVFTQVELLVAQ